MEFEDARYEPVPERSPYTRTDRYETVKEYVKAIIAKLKKTADPEKNLTLADICCANGEMLYHLKKNFPKWEFRGYDLEPAFIETAKNYEGLRGVRFEVSNLFDVGGEYDIVTCTGALPVFDEIEPVLEKLLSLCKKGGLMLVDGIFNKFDVEVWIAFKDLACPETKDKWRTGFHKHSYKRISEFLEGKVEHFEFGEVEMGVELPLDPKAVLNTFTFRDINNKIHITNGMGVLLDKVLLTVRK